MDTAHWPQEIGMKPMEDHQLVLQNSTNNNSCSSKPSSNSSSLERRTLARPQKESAINCPRCNSTNTKFCYYNNYSLSQPRYFCKTCRRYWTEGGSLRNVPVGGGSRKNKRSSSISSHSSMSKKLPDLVLPPAPNPSQNPKIHHHHHEYGHGHGHGQDLNLGFQSAANNNQDFKTISELIQVPNFIDGNKNSATTTNTTTSGSATTTTNSAQLSALELLTGMTTRGGGGNGMMNSFMPIPIPDPNSVYSIPMPEFKIPSLSFSLDGNGMGGGNGTYGSGIQESSSGRLLFPFEDLKTSTTTTTATHGGDQQNRDQNGDTNGFWSGMLGGNSW